MKRYLAIDIGASSGRHVVGWRENGEFETREVFRFPNGVRGGSYGGANRLQRQRDRDD